MNRSQAAQDTVHTTPHTERAQRRAGAKRPGTPHTQHHTQDMHAGEQEPGGPGHRTRGTAHHTSNLPPKRTQPTPPCRKKTPCQTTKTNRPAKANPAGTKRVGRQGRPAKRDRGTRRGRRGERNKAPPLTYTHPTAANLAAAGRQQGPPWSQMGPPERGCVPAPAQQHARARSARHTQAKQATRAAPHASTHHGTKHDTTTANTHARRRTSSQEEVLAPQSPQRKSRRPDGRVCTWQGTQPLLAMKQPPSGRTCVRPAVNPAPADYEPAAVRMDVCAPSSEPSPCRLRNSRRPEGRVCARQ